MVIFIDAFWCSLCFASMIVVYYVSIEASFIATFYPTIWRIFHIHHASINTAIGYSWSYFIWLYALRKCLKDARFAWYSATYMECKQPTEEWFLTDVLLFTHLMHLPAAYASKTLQWSYALRSSMDISQKLYSSNTVRRAFKVLFEDRMSDSSCCRQIRRRIGCRYGVQIYLSENRYILADKDRQGLSITHTPKHNLFRLYFFIFL